VKNPRVELVLGVEIRRKPGQFESTLTISYAIEIVCEHFSRFLDGCWMSVWMKNCLGVIFWREQRLNHEWGIPGLTDFLESWTDDSHLI
jgi:hypothetical protein